MSGMIHFVSVVNHLYQRVIDNFIQLWHVDKDNNGVLTLYVNLKVNFEFEAYLNLLPSNLRFFISKIRMCSQPLRIHTGRYGVNRVQRNEGCCTYCDMHDLEDEYNCILLFPTYNDIRQKYIKRYYYVNPSVIKFIELFNTNCKNVLKNLALYIK